MGQALRGLIGGVSKAAGQVADNRITRYTAERVAAQRDEAEKDKELRIEEMMKRSEARAVTTSREQDAYEASPERIQQQIDSEDVLSRGLITSRINRASEEAGAVTAEFDAGAGNREAALNEELANAQLLSNQELEAEIARLSNQQLIDAQEAANPGSARMAKIALETAELALLQSQAIAIIPPAERLQYDALQADLEIISKAIAKSQAEGMWDAEEPSVIQQLSERSRISARITELLAPYMQDALPMDGQPDEEDIRLLNEDPEGRRQYFQNAFPELNVDDFITG